jgi:hypothetical protein
MSNEYKQTLARFEKAVRAHAFIGSCEAIDPRRNEIQQEYEEAKRALTHKLQYRQLSAEEKKL